jgi:hypothetical protein
MRIKVVSKDVHAKENGAKAWVVLKYSHARPKTKLQKRHL